MAAGHDHGGPRTRDHRLEKPLGPRGTVPSRPTEREYKTVVQGIALAAAVMPTLEDQDTAIDVLLWLAVVWTVVTGIQYLIDGQHALSATGD